MTEQLKAEAFVREARPALMELTFGCEVKDTHNQQYYKVCNKSVNGDLFVSFGTLASSQYRIAEERIIIIGHPINLQDWLGVLWESNPNLEYTDAQMPLAKFGARAWYGLEKAPSDWLWFDATTGQPATESDYQAFNEIVS